MSRLRMNTLQLHFSENEGFRLMSEKYPEMMSEQYLTKEQVKDIIRSAAKYLIAVIPSVQEYSKPYPPGLIGCCSCKRTKKGGITGHD